MEKPIISLNPGEYETSVIRLAAFDINRIASDLAFIAHNSVIVPSDAVMVHARELQQIAKDILEETREK